jgi:hypothetical protein
MRQGSQVLREDTHHLLSARHDDKVQQGTARYESLRDMYGREEMGKKANSLMSWQELLRCALLATRVQRWEET